MSERPIPFGSYRQAFAFVAAGTLMTALIFGALAWVFLNICTFADALIEGRAFPTIPHAEPVR